MKLTSVFCQNGEVLNRLKELNPLRNKLYSITDEITLGRMFADTYGSVLKYNVTSKTWYCYDGIVWREDTGEVITGRCAEVFARLLKVYLAETVSADATEFEKNYEKFALRLGDRNKRLKMIQDARNHTHCKTEDFDRQKEYLNVKNGVVNLVTFELMEHDSQMLLTKVCNCEYDSQASSAVWEKFLSEVLEGDQEKTEYLQRLCGYALTANNSNEEFYILYGKTTRNGKSTFLGTIQKMLGTYALSIKPESLALRKKDGRTASGDIARLHSCRFLHCSEPQKGMMFDVALLKEMTGRDIITARNLYEREFDFVPVFKLFINTNVLPTVNDMTLFSSGRVKVIEFNRHFSEAEQDRRLKDVLEENLSGVLNWCIEGLKKYYTDGTNPPECVKSATDTYRQNSDKIGSFIEECLEKKDICNLTVKETYDTYRRWCSANGFRTEGKTVFKELLSSKVPVLERGTVRGKTCFNVVNGFTFTQEGMELSASNY